MSSRCSFRILLAFATAFASTLMTLAQTNVIDEVVWVVGDEAILRSDVERRRNEFGSSFTGNPYCVIPEQLAVQKLFLHQAVIDSVEVGEAEINQYVEQDINEKIMMAGSKEKLEEYMKMTVTAIREELYDEYKNELTARQMKQKITEDVKVNAAEVRRYFRDLPEDSLPLIPTQVEVQILVQQDTAAIGSLRLEKRYFMLGETGLADPIVRDDSLLLTAERTLSVILELWQQKDWQRMYLYIARQDGGTGLDRPVYRDFVAAMEALPALTEASFTGGSVSTDGSVTTFSLSARLRMPDGSDEERPARTLRLRREDGLWRITMTQLTAWMEVSP